MSEQDKQDFLESDESYESLPEPEHVEMIMNGMLDSLSGNEDLIGLTDAQVYLQGALNASGAVSLRVSGNEGFFSSIGAGIKAAWDYIVKMFKSIYNSVFKKDVKDKGEKVATSIKEAEEAIKAVESPKVTPANVEATLKKMETKVEHMPPSPQKTKLIENLTAAKEAPEAQKVKSAIDMLPEVFDIALLSAKQLEAHTKSLKAAASRLKERQDAYDKDHDQMGYDIQTYLNGLIGLPEPHSVTNLAAAKEFLHKASRCKEAMGNSWMSLWDTEQRTKGLIDELGKQVNAYAESDKNTEIKKEIEILKTYLTGVTEVNKITETVTLALLGMCDVIKKACVVVI